MTEPLLLIDHATRDDLRIFLERLTRVGQPEVRMVTRGQTLAVYGCTQMPRGIMDSVPVVLVMRAFALTTAPELPVDTTVQSRSVLDRIARLGIIGLALDTPDVTTIVSWAGVLPPQTGWSTLGAIDGSSLAQVAKEGITRVAALLPQDPGEAVVHTVRSSVWGMEIAPGVPAATAFAAESMGFLGGDEPLRLTRTQAWVRLSSDRGHVLVRTPMGE